MAIKVIKHGKKPTLKKVCSVCGCEFEFDASDLQEEYCLNAYPSYKRRYIVCPDCGERIFYDTVADPIIYPQPYYPTPQPLEPWYPNNWPWITWTTTPNLTLENNLYDCDKCPNKPDPTKTVVGDTPCTWCRKNQPYCTSLEGSSLQFNTTDNTFSTQFSEDFTKLK